MTANALFQAVCFAADGCGIAKAGQADGRGVKNVEILAWSEGAVRPDAHTCQSTSTLASMGLFEWLTSWCRSLLLSVLHPP